MLLAHKALWHLGLQWTMLNVQLIWSETDTHKDSIPQKPVHIADCRQQKIWKLVQSRKCGEDHSRRHVLSAVSTLVTRNNNNNNKLVNKCSKHSVDLQINVPSSIYFFLSHVRSLPQVITKLGKTA